MDIFMKAVIDEAKCGMNEGRIPISSVLVKGGKIIGRGHNKRVQENNPIMPAEMPAFIMLEGLANTVTLFVIPR